VARALVEVRRATPDDLPDILLLLSESREELTRQGRSTMSAEHMETRLRELLAGRQVEILLARREDRPAGFLTLRETPLAVLAEQSALCIDHLYVSAPARRHGVARALLAQVAGHAERAGCDQIIAGVTPWARDMNRFFARLGFAPVTVRRSVTPSVLRRRLGGDRHRPHLEDLLSRRRSLRARSKLSSLLSDDLPLDGDERLA
jgi:ribosomal protein S18 acetylase RimI-like enzyme